MRINCPMSQHDNKNEKQKAKLTLSSPFSFVTSRFKSHASTTEGEGGGGLIERGAY